MWWLAEKSETENGGKQLEVYAHEKEDRKRMLIMMMMAV